MEFKEWLTKYKEERQISEVQLRMVSSGNNLVCSQPKPRYGIYFYTDEEAGNEELPTFMGNTFGGICTPDIEFYVKDFPWLGYKAKRQHGEEYRDRRNVGISLTKKGADKMNYKSAAKLAKKIALQEGAKFVNFTRKDLAHYMNGANRNNLGYRFWKYWDRVLGVEG